MATHSSILPWKMPWTEEPGGPQTVGHKELDMTERLNKPVLLVAITSFSSKTVLITPLLSIVLNRPDFVAWSVDKDQRSRTLS